MIFLRARQACAQRRFWWPHLGDADSWRRLAVFQALGDGSWTSDGVHLLPLVSGPFPVRKMIRSPWEGGLTQGLLSLT